MKTCKQCGQPMASDAAEGLCARCLLSAAIKESTSAGGGPAVPHEAPEPAAIAVHFPQLEILELLGRGGMGMVYKARQPQLDRIVALKILPPADGLDPEFAERFTREARALARLSHPNIVAVYEFGQTPATSEGAVGLFYLLMEYVDGANLRQLLQTKTITPAEALAIVPKICEALQFAHEEGVTHRDIKPENILIDKKGRVKIADFGLAKIVGHDGDAFTLTQAGMSLGTPRYMAPEQVENPGSVDHRADIYSLGVVFYEMLTGELPMGRFAPPSEKVQVDVRLDDIVLRSLEKDVERRYQHASELRSDVEDVTAPKAAPPSSAPGEWLVKCVACGHTKPLREAGGLRIGGGTSGTSRFPIVCSNCGGGVGTIVRAGSTGQSTKGGANEGDAAAASQGSRLSRTAVIGAIWGALGAIGFLILMPAWLWTRVDVVVAGSPPPSGPPFWVIALSIPVALLAVSAPFGCTILGGLAIGQIKRSGGRLHGLPLAAADLLAYPLLVLTGLVMALAGTVFEAIAPVAPGHASRGPLPSLLVAILASVFVAIFAWRKISGKAPLSTADATPKPRHALSALLAVAWLITFFLGVSFNASRTQTAAGIVKTVTIGALDPLFVWRSEPTGFHNSFHFLSWSMFALLLSVSLFCALWRLGREDAGKAPRDPAWWRSFFAQHGTLLGLLLLVLLITGKSPRPLNSNAASKTATPAIFDDKTRAFETRIDGALAISGDTERHAALQVIALDAAGQGVARSAKRAVEKMSYVTEHDDTAARCAKLLAPHDMAGAIEIAQLIRGNSLRDLTLGTITKPAATPAVERAKIEGMLKDLGVPVAPDESTEALLRKLESVKEGISNPAGPK